MFRVHPFSCAAQLKPPTHILTTTPERRPHENQAFHLCRSTLYREDHPPSAAGVPRIWPRSPEADLRQLGYDGPLPAVAPQERRYSWQLPVAGGIRHQHGGSVLLAPPDGAVGAPA